MPTLLIRHNTGVIPMLFELHMQSTALYGMLQRKLTSQPYPVQVAKHWTTLPSKVVNASCLSVFKKHLYNALNEMFQLLVNLEVTR